MFADKSKERVMEVIKAEYDNAKKRWGDTYASLHEGYGVLAEEVFECRKEYKAIKNTQEALFRCIVEGFNKNEKQVAIEACFAHASLLALEACQVAAVCQKMLGGTKN